MFNALEIRTVVADVRVVGTVWLYAYVSSRVEELFKKYELFTVSCNFCCFTTFIPETFCVLFKSIGYGF